MFQRPIAIYRLSSQVLFGLHDQSPHWLNCHCFPCTSAVVRVVFDATQYTVNEETGEVTLTIVKLDDTSSEVSVIFSTDDGTGMMAATGKYVLNRLFTTFTNYDVIERQNQKQSSLADAYIKLSVFVIPDCLIFLGFSSSLLP